MTNEPRKPIPYPSPETERYWQACKQHELWLPYCHTCQKFFWYPRPFCPTCFGWEIEWRQTSGKGRVYSFSIQYRSQAPGFEPPYVTAIVQLDEGPRMLTNLVGVDADPEHVRCDMAVEVTFEDVNDEITLPMFRPAEVAS
jgi:uncharacterized OB-fold protein